MRDHYQKLGFIKRDEKPDGTTIWTMATSFEIAAVPMTVRRTGSAVAAV